MFSLWQYIRERTRDAFLSGIQDAIEVLEQGVDPQVCFEAARQLKNRLTNLTAGSTDTETPSQDQRTPPHEGANPGSIGGHNRPQAASQNSSQRVPTDDMTQRLENAKHQMAPRPNAAPKQHQVPPPRKRPHSDSTED